MNTERSPILVLAVVGVMGVGFIYRYGTVIIWTDDYWRLNWWREGDKVYFDWVDK